MLYNVSQAMAAMSLQVVRNHPNTWDVQVLRKIVTRQAPSGEMGGAANFGGVGVLDSQDENEYEYQFLCNGHALKGEQYQPGNMSDRLDMPVTNTMEFAYLLAPSKDTPPEVAPLGFQLKDVVLFMLGVGPNAARVGYEVTQVDATCELPPFLPRYLLNRRADLDIAATP